MKERDPNLSGEPSSEKHSSGPDKGLAVLVILMFFVPIILLMAIYDTEPYHIVPGESFSEAMKAAGVSVVSEKDMTTSMQGQDWKTYMLSDKSGNTVTVSVKAFDSAESRDTAVQAYNSNTVGKGQPVGRLIVVGQYLVYVTPADSIVVKELSAELEKLRAS
ncbi:MAG TPA: hypothetical protein P5217_01595 [Methanoregulaceae archaeon]|nr:hypothetical protein [Methanoregulaceae archaeon]HPD75189.1 hypothetical protein [Methanoregulaceae archaeon]HRY74954.1 hypothetical protein [Methanoregulaceae archaeon]